MLLCSSVFSPVLCHLLKPDSLLIKVVDDALYKTHGKQNTESMHLLKLKKDTT